MVTECEGAVMVSGMDQEIEVAVDRLEAAFEVAMEDTPLYRWLLEAHADFEFVQEKHPQVVSQLVLA